MKIIKQGHPLLRPMMRFKCNICGCEFVMNKKQQQVKQNSQVDIALGCSAYYTECPWCGREAEGDFVNE